MAEEKRKSEPTRLWHPTTGETKVFDHPNDAPDGWLNSPPAQDEEEVVEPKLTTVTKPARRRPDPLLAQKE